MEGERDVPSHALALGAGRGRRGSVPAEAEVAEAWASEPGGRGRGLRRREQPSFGQAESGQHRVPKIMQKGCEHRRDTARTKNPPVLAVGRQASEEGDGRSATSRDLQQVSEGCLRDPDLPQQILPRQILQRRNPRIGACAVRRCHTYAHRVSCTALLAPMRLT